MSSPPKLATAGTRHHLPGSAVADVGVQQRDAVLALLNYDNLMAGSDATDRRFGVPKQTKPTLPTLLSLEDFGPANLWLYAARQSARTPTSHTTACLATWLFFQPGAVKDPTKTVLALTQRGFAAHQFVAQRHGQPPQQNPAAHDEAT